MTDEKTPDEIARKIAYSIFTAKEMPYELIPAIDVALTAERWRAEKAEAERDEYRRLLIRCVNEGTDGFAGDAVSLEFLRGVPAECAGMKRQRDEAVHYAETNLSIARSDGHHDGWRDACLASPLNVDRIERETIEVDRIERETIERCAKVADARNALYIAAAIRAMREESHE